MIHRWCLEDKSLAEGTLLLLRIVPGQRSALTQTPRHAELLMFAHANNQILSACCGAQTFCRCHKITPAVFQRTTTACRFWQGYLAGRGVTQYYHSAVLHQFHWVDSDGLLPLIGCWAVITTSNNDRYFKDSRESRNKENWQWFLFFLGVLLSFSFFGIFWHCS